MLQARKTGLYVNGTKLLVVKVAGAASFTSDTTADVTVKKGASYQYKITASAAPSFTLGTSGVFNYTLVSKSGNDYFYKITAVGAVGSSTGVYVNGQKVNVATVG
jgi:pSer/pThr/pTyr-binding forkhead associated (FHA) protein